MWGSLCPPCLALMQPEELTQIQGWDLQSLSQSQQSYPSLTLVNSSGMNQLAQGFIQDHASDLIQGNPWERTFVWGFWEESLPFYEKILWKCSSPEQMGKKAAWEATALFLGSQGGSCLAMAHSRKQKQGGKPVLGNFIKPLNQARRAVHVLRLFLPITRAL